MNDQQLCSCSCEIVALRSVAHPGASCFDMIVFISKASHPHIVVSQVRFHELAQAYTDSTGEAILPKTFVLPDELDAAEEVTRLLGRRTAVATWKT